MVYAIVVGFSLLCGGGAILVLLFGWRAEERDILTHTRAEADRKTVSEIHSIEEIQAHVDAELAGLDEFASHPSARSLYAAKEGAASAA
ncbi:MAG: hypothetical protein AAB434_05585 [Planctomycetota bacterium]|mgnify:CR=1 FL=1